MGAIKGNGASSSTPWNAPWCSRAYRTRLIADVVTGKLDVRAAAAQLPSEAYESEMVDDAEALTENEDLADGMHTEEAEV